VCQTFDYHKAPELIQLGRELTGKALDDFENGRS
jgi:NTE family protein